MIDPCRWFGRRLFDARYGLVVMLLAVLEQFSRQKRIQDSVFVPTRFVGRKSGVNEPYSPWPGCDCDSSRP